MKNIITYQTKLNELCNLSLNGWMVEWTFGFAHPFINTMSNGISVLIKMQWCSATHTCSSTLWPILCIVHHYPCTQFWKSITNKVCTYAQIVSVDTCAICILLWIFMVGSNWSSMRHKLPAALLECKTHQLHMQWFILTQKSSPFPSLSMRILLSHFPYPPPPITLLHL